MAESPLASLLAGQLVRSESTPGVGYRLQHVLGEGGMGIALYAIRQGPGGSTPAVLKVMKPDVMASAGPTAALMIQKEAVALGRLNERVPPTPFVVRFMDTGTVAVDRATLPWIALEYVHGGAEGTTLEQRVAYSVKNTTFAFDASRTTHTVECLAEGLAAIHDVGVVHRDLTPGNVLCCGFGASEILKIADFGIARPAGVTNTFGSVLLGTPGYAAPEQSFSSEGDVGPWTDVFGFACVVFYALTGEQYFDTANFAQALLMVRDTRRRSLLECRGLSPEFRENPAICRNIDQVFARATAMTPTERHPSAQEFAGAILPSLRGAAGPRSQRASERWVQSVASRPFERSLANWTWTVRHPPGDDRLVRGIAWDGDGHGLAVTTDGLSYWNGSTWQPAAAVGIDPALGLRSISLVRPGRWIIGGESGLLAMIGGELGPTLFHGPPAADFSLVNGDPLDLALAVSETGNSPPLLYTVAAGHFFRPVPLEAARTIAAIARLDEARWIVAGRTTQGTGFAAVYSALEFEATFLLAPPTDALTTCAAHLDRGIGVAAGRRGVAVRFDAGRTESTIVESSTDVASAAMDVQGRAWAGASGRLWTQSPEPRAPWFRAWEDPGFRTPFVSLRADLGVVTAMTVDGAVLEGRAG
ncbi:MAG TPA: serine/threonine-protein kinase [Polyangiaceae bacterium]|nr:serine/threonine-protein kinase [Polyangiaceae bacterium]